MAILVWILVLSLVGITWTDQAPAIEGEGTPMASELALTYRATGGGHTPVDLELQVGADGQATLFLGSSYSLPHERLNRVGRFGRSLTDDDLRPVVNLLSGNDLMSQGGNYGEAFPDAVSRFLAIDFEGEHAEFQLTGMTTTPSIDTLEQALQALGARLTKDPVAAWEATLSAEAEAETLNPSITLQVIGREALTTTLVNSEQGSTLIQMVVAVVEQMPLPSGGSMPLPRGSVTLDPHTIQTMVSANALPSGETTLEPGTRFTFELPSMTLTGARDPMVAVGTVTLWESVGRATRALTVVTPDVALS